MLSGTFWLKPFWPKCKQGPKRASKSSKAFKSVVFVLIRRGRNALAKSKPNEMDLDTKPQGGLNKAADERTEKTKPSADHKLRKGFDQFTEGQPVGDGFAAAAG